MICTTFMNLLSSLNENESKSVHGNIQCNGRRDLPLPVFDVSRVS